MKKIRKKIEAYILPKLAVIVAKVLDMTITYKYVNGEYLDEAKDFAEHGGFAFALYHNNALCSIACHKTIENGYALTSQSKDGDLVANFAKTFGIKSIRGSSNKGGREALVKLIRATREGGRVAFAVDGPKGPKGEVKSGIIFLSQKLQVPILPFSAVADRYWELSKTWDKTRIPKPFSRVTVTYGKPYVVEKQADVDASRKILAQRLEGLEKNP